MCWKLLSVKWGKHNQITSDNLWNIYGKVFQKFPSKIFLRFHYSNNSFHQTFPTDSFIKFLEWRGFFITTKFCYAFYLIQIPIFQLSIANTRDIRYFTASSMINLNELFVICASAVLMTLLIETPFNNIKQNMLSPKKFDKNSNEVREKRKLKWKSMWRWKHVSPCVPTKTEMFFFRFKIIERIPLKHKFRRRLKISINKHKVNLMVLFIIMNTESDCGLSWKRYSISISPWSLFILIKGVINKWCFLLGCS